MIYVYVCNACEATDSRSSYRSGYVCPWCGEGVMHLEDEYSDDDGEDNDDGK